VNHSSDLATVIREAIKAERSRRGLTQEQLATAMGTPFTGRIVFNIERGARTVASHELPELCTALGVTLSRLLVDADPKDRAALGL
jgi:transcriptional regulator with XRE-family HTH domain